MKFTFCMFATVFTLAFVAANNSEILVNFKVSSAQLKYAVEAILKVYVIDTPAALKLPLNSTKLRHLNYFEYELPPTNKSAHPTWTVTDGLPGTFNASSDMAIEIWQRISDSVSIYVGGTQFTVASLLKYPAHFNRSVIDEPNNLTAGTFFFEWHAPK